MESLYDIWSKRNPQWEKRYQESIMDVFTDYGRGTTSYQHARAKIFGAGYEAFIIAFFIGLYLIGYMLTISLVPGIHPTIK